MFVYQKVDPVKHLDDILSPTIPKPIPSRQAAKKTANALVATVPRPSECLDAIGIKHVRIMAFPNGPNVG